MNNENDDLNETPAQKARRLGVKVIPPRKPTPPQYPGVRPQQPPPVNDTIAVCGACGIELKRIMHFACARNDCPCFNKFT